jgi:hypothetical protein
MLFIPLKTRRRINIVDEDKRTRPQGHVDEQLDEDRRHRWQHLRSSTHVRCIDISRAPVQQSSRRTCTWIRKPVVDGVLEVEEPLTRKCSPKRGSQAGGERDSWEERMNE